ncbi:MAG: hypothetical protein GQ524_01925 [Anaerolineales bacterium]|nr:hypothetical protein [Anaerolineales bacterium]
MKNVAQWEKVAGECPQCGEESQLIALIYRHAHRDGSTSQSIEGERCLSCRWHLDYTDLGIISHQLPFTGFKVTAKVIH